MFEVLRDRDPVIKSLGNATSHSYLDICSRFVNVFDFDASKTTGSGAFGFYQPIASTLESGGIYALYCRNVFERSTLLYIGQTDNLRERLLKHYSVSVGDSAMKNKLKTFARSSAKNSFYGSSEEELNQWMQINVLVKCIAYKKHVQIEKYIIEALHPLLNHEYSLRPLTGNIGGGIPRAFLGNAASLDSISVPSHRSNHTFLSNAGRK